MALHLSAVRIDAVDPYALARFWAGLLDRTLDGGPADDVVTALPRGGAVALRFVRTPTPKTARNRLHLDLTSRSVADQERMVERVVELGGAPYDVGQTGDEGHVVLADPDGNEFCVIEPENKFLAGTGPIGALNADGLRATGVFWSAALGWPLVWDQDEETAIQSPQGGSKLTWSGPPLLDKPATGRNRWRLELTPDDDAARYDEAERLVALGAKIVDPNPDATGAILLTDPDDNEFHLA